MALIFLSASVACLDSQLQKDLVVVNDGRMLYSAYFGGICLDLSAKPAASSQDELIPDLQR
jgi:hypothetical protein